MIVDMPVPTKKAKKPTVAKRSHRRKQRGGFSKVDISNLIKLYEEGITNLEQSQNVDINEYKQQVIEYLTTSLAYWNELYINSQDYTNDVNVMVNKDFILKPENRTFEHFIDSTLSNEESNELLDIILTNNENNENNENNKTFIKKLIDDIKNDEINFSVQPPAESAEPSQDLVAEAARPELVAEPVPSAELTTAQPETKPEPTPEPSEPEPASKADSQQASMVTTKDIPNIINEINNIVLGLDMYIKVSGLTLPDDSAPNSEKLRFLTALANKISQLLNKFQEDLDGNASYVSSTNPNVYADVIQTAPDEIKNALRAQSGGARKKQRMRVVHG
jgi:hypothetical protein